MYTYRYAYRSLLHDFVDASEPWLAPYMPNSPTRTSVLPELATTSIKDTSHIILSDLHRSDGYMFSYIGFLTESQPAGNSLI